MRVKRGRPFKTTPTHPIKIRITLDLYTLLVSRLLPRQSLGEALDAYIQHLKENPYENISTRNST